MHCTRSINLIPPPIKRQATRAPADALGLCHKPAYNRGSHASLDTVMSNTNNAEEVLVALRRVIRATDLHSKQLIKTATVTAPQLLLMQAIKRQGDAIISELAHEVSLSQATVTTILDRLERRELIFRKRSEADKRKVHVYLTEDGEKILRKAPTALQHQFAEKFAALNDWEQSMILSALQRIAQMMDAQDIDASPFLETGELDEE